MSQIIIPGDVARFPDVPFNTTGAGTSITLDATGETVVFGGYIILENPLSGSKTISAAGGGKIIWNLAAATFANVASVFKVGLQDVSAATSPMQGDGVFDVSKTYTGTGLTANTIESVMDTGSKVVANGQLVAIVLEFTTRAGVDTLDVRVNHNGTHMSPVNMPAVMTNNTGAYVRQTASYPNAIIVFDDGTLGWIYGYTFNSFAPTGIVFNVNTAGADEYGNYIKPNSVFVATGIAMLGHAADATSDFELNLYTDPLGTPTIARSVTVDATQLGASGAASEMLAVFSSPYVLRPYTEYAITGRPTTTGNLNMRYTERDGLGATYTNQGVPNNISYAVNRLNNTGAFVDYNGGTAKTRWTFIWLLGTHMEQGGGFSNSQLGM